MFIVITGGGRFDAGYANSYLLLIQLSMFSRTSSIHSKTNSITK
jgi:hypothetical protein